MNENIKREYIEYLIGLEKSSARMYNKLFDFVKKYEEKLEKDLYEFDKKDLMEVCNEMAKTTRYNTVTTYNGLIYEYKEWCQKQGIKESVLETCSRKELSQIKHYKKYTILNDEDIRILTELEPLEGADFNVAIFMRAFWEIDAQEKTENVLKIKNTDLNYENSTLKIGNNIYPISNYLKELICEYANMDMITFKGKLGRYKMFTAEEFGGYVIRPTSMSIRRLGEPLTPTHLSNVFIKYHQRRLKVAKELLDANEVERITVNDIIMSLALKYMVTNKKTHAEMATARRYFSNVPSAVYKMVFDNFAKTKFPEEYAEYLRYYNKLQEKYDK